MHTLISSHLKGEEKEKFEALWKSNTMIRERLVEIILQKINAAEAARISEKGYGDPAWPYKQADTNGELRTLRDMLQLLKG